MAARSTRTAFGDGERDGGGAPCDVQSDRAESTSICRASHVMPKTWTQKQSPRPWAASWRCGECGGGCDGDAGGGGDAKKRRIVRLHAGARV